MVERDYQAAVLRSRNIRVTIGDKEPQPGDDENIITGNTFNYDIIPVTLLISLTSFMIRKYSVWRVCWTWAG